MSNSSRPRWRAAATIAIAVVFVAASLTAHRAAAFKLGPHTQILQQSIGLRIDQSTFADILGSLPTGQGNLGSDQHQFDKPRHFDSAPGPQAVCDRATAAWSRFYVEIRDSVQPQNAPDYVQISGISKARSAFGALTHALQDFYAHSNWVDLYVAAGQSPPLATSLFPNCIASSLPAGLQTGFFDLAYGVAGCPVDPFSVDPNNPAWMPPPGFTYCHETLNKDSNQTYHGRELIPGTTQTYYALAAQLATAHTSALYDAVVNSLTIDWMTKFPQVRADCLVRRVMVADVPQPCRYPKLSFINDSYNGGTKLADGTVTIRDATGATVVSKPVSKGSWPFPEISVPKCLPGLSVEWQFFVDDDVITPVARKVTGNSQFGGAGCDADIHIVPENLLTYLVRYTDADTVIPFYTNITVTVNNGQRLVSTGPVVAGSTIWIDLGPCSTVANLDFIYEFIDPTDNATPRTASPDPASPFPAHPGCLDKFLIDLGGQIYP